jgi:hypothetical protein
MAFFFILSASSAKFVLPFTCWTYLAHFLCHACPFQQVNFSVNFLEMAGKKK